MKTVEAGQYLADSVMSDSVNSPLPKGRKDMENDLIHSPAHYQSESGIEAIDAIEAQLTPEEFRGFCKGNAAKYIWRERHKGGYESISKAAWYLGKLKEE